MFINWTSSISNAAGFTVVAVFILLVVLSAVSSIVIYFLLSGRVAKLENDYAIQSEFIVKTRAKILADRQDINKLLRIIEPNTDNIKSLQEQVSQINELLGSVMGASDLITSGLDSPVERVEEARERIKWERERRRLNQINESDFYES